MPSDRADKSRLPWSQRKPVVVDRDDLKHVLDVFIDNGMVEAEDEEIVNRLWESVQ